MKCLRCQNEMIQGFTGSGQITCFTNGCPVTSYVQYSDDTYHWVFNFPQFEFIFVKTGKVNGNPLTTVVEDLQDSARILFTFHNELLNMSENKLKTILVFR